MLSKDNSFLYQRSIEILLQNQAPSGAFLACPNFPTYRYAWFRDGAFCAYALDLAGYPDCADRFHDWAAGTVYRHAEKINRCIDQAQKGIAPEPSVCFHSRFTPEGEEVPGHWGFHQLDGLGTWLWALCRHRRIEGDGNSPDRWRPAIELVRDYLLAMWRYPCSDCWEENETQVHPYTLAAIFAGLKALGDTLGDSRSGESAAEIQAWVLEHGVLGGNFVKSVGSSGVDASLLALNTPYGLAAIDDPVMQATIREVQANLGSQAGGLRRYAADTYYGGGEWIILSAWLGWCLAEAGVVGKAGSIIRWVEAQADAEGDLPEQVPGYLNAPDYYPVWIQRWGPVATPLLWSHAMYVILANAVEKNLIISGSPA